MNTRYLFILTAAVLVTSAFAIGITSAPSQTALAQQQAQNCRSTQFETGTTSLFCLRDDPNTPGFSGSPPSNKGNEDCKAIKEESEGVKCSQSQTGFGRIRN